MHAKTNNSFPRLHEHILNKPFFGICLGFQILFEKSYEDNGVDCLSIIKGSVNDFSKQISQDLKVPHMGWNNVEQKKDHIIWSDIPRTSFFILYIAIMLQLNLKRIFLLQLHMI